jgi:hypothetical protein
MLESLKFQSKNKKLQRKGSTKRDEEDGREQCPEMLKSDEIYKEDPLLVSRK